MDGEKIPEEASLHVLFLPLMSQGHAIPAFQFAETLASEGAIVTILCEKHSIKRQLRSQSGPGQRIRLIELPEYSHHVEQLQEPNGAAPDHPLIDFLGRMEHQLVPCLEETMTRLVKESKLSSDVPPPMCIISDFFLSFSQDTANNFGIPRYVFFPSASSCLSEFLYFPRLVEQGIVPVGPDTKADIVIPGLPLLESLELPLGWHEKYVPKEWIKYILSALPRLHESSGIILNTFHALEQELLDVATTEAINPNKIPIYPVGPILPSKIFHDGPVIDKEAKSEKHNEILEWLNRQSSSSVLYIAFGSGAILSIPQIQELAKALEACKQPFLWILRLPPSAREASSVLPEGFLSRTQSYGLVISTWAPQLLILSHPSTGGFMTHCGWNSLMESICSGVPMLPLPQFAEQYFNCKLVTEHFKVGVKVVRGADGVAESKEIEKGVKKLMQGEEGEGLRRRTRRLREEAARCVSKDGSSFATLRAFIQEASSSYKLKQHL